MIFVRLFRYVILYCLFGCTPLAISADPLNLHVLDVGEGQSVLLHANNRAVLIDTGHAGMVESVLKRMEVLGVQQLDYLFLTHLHADHASGYFRVQEQFPQVMTLDSCYSMKADSGGDMERWIDNALRQNPHRVCVARGDRIEWQGSQIDVLWPIPGTALEKGLNHNSLVLQLRRGDRILLIMGDADRQAEQMIMQQKPLPPVDILVAGHHGAADASSPAFLQAVRPKTVVVSVNRDNLRGYPDRETLDRLDQFSERLHLTSESGEFHAILE